MHTHIDMRAHQHTRAHTHTCTHTSAHRHTHGQTCTHMCTRAHACVRRNSRVLEIVVPQLVLGATRRGPYHTIINIIALSIFVLLEGCSSICSTCPRGPFVLKFCFLFFATMISYLIHWNLI